MRLGSTLALGALLASALSACEATLPEGTFVCDSNADCPDGWRCAGDSRCYSTDFEGFELYEVCTADEDCLSGTCLTGFDTMASVGRCSEPCSGGVCPMAPNERAGICQPMQGCFAACETSAECSGDERCVVVPMTVGETACMELQGAGFDGRTACTSRADCAPGTVCARAPDLDALGVCVWPCSPNGECPTGASCQALPETVTDALTEFIRFACMADCNGTPGNCGADLSCQAFPDSELHCAPSGW